MLDFPASPTLGQQFTAAGVTWTWDGTKWTASGLGVAYLPLAGGTMLGPLILAADPTQPLQAATAQYADRPRYGDNRLINGDMRIDQRNNGASGTATGVYTVDRWKYGASQASRGTWQRLTAGGGGLIQGIGYSLQFTSSSAYTPATNDNFQFFQPIEADMVSDLAWGTANAQPVTLSFWAQSTLTGTFGGLIGNWASTRTYPFTYSLPTANTWTKIVINIPGDTAGTWVLQGNAASMWLAFDLGSGSGVRAPANAWTSAASVSGATGAVNVVATNGAIFVVTGVKLEIGSVATPYNHPPLAQALAACQRYYQLGGVQINAYLPGAGNSHTLLFPYPVVMRAAPTMTSNFTTTNNCTGSVSASGVANYQPQAVAVAAGMVNLAGNWTASAEL